MNFKSLAYALVAVFALNVVALSAVCNKKSCQIKRAQEAKK